MEREKPAQIEGEPGFFEGQHVAGGHRALPGAGVGGRWGLGHEAQALAQLGLAEAIGVESHYQQLLGRPNGAGRNAGQGLHPRLEPRRIRPRLQARRIKYHELGRSGVTTKVGGLPTAPGKQRR